MEILPGIHRIQVPNPTSDRVFLNSYLIQGKDGWLMVDTGWGTAAAFDTVADGLSDLGIDFADIKEIVITHSHPDHYGLADKIRELSKAKLVLHQAEIPASTSKFTNMQDFLEMMAQWLQMNGASDEDLPRLLEASPGMKAVRSFGIPDEFLNGGEIVSTGLFDFQVIWTPGHSPGHICLYERDRKILLSGDHILPHITPNIGFAPWSGSNPLGSYLTSLRKLERLEVDIVLPAHEWVFKGLVNRINELIHHHEQRKKNILNVFGSRSRTAFQIAFHIPWSVDGKETCFGDLSPIDKRMAIWETLAHLELLRAESAADSHNREGTIFYTAMAS